MTTLEARIAEVLVVHGQHDYRFNGGNWSDNCACGFKLFGIDYSPEHKVFPGTSYADCAHAAHQATMLAPVIRGAKVEALREAVSDFEAHVGVGEFDEQTRRDGRHHGHVEEAWDYQSPYMDWLRNRADNLEAS